MTWKNPTADFNHARVYRSEQSGALGRLLKDMLTIEEYVDADSSSGTMHYYTVRAVDAAGNESSTISQANARTEAAKKKPAAPKVKRMIKRALGIGSRGNDVNFLQEVLKNEGLYNGAATGKFDKATREALVKFQEKYAAELLKPFKLKKGTGFVGFTTRKKLNALLNQ